MQMHFKVQQKTQAIILLFTLGVTWGSGYSIAYYVTHHGVSPLGYAFWQSLGPAICLTILCKTTGLGLPFSRQHVIYYFICGLLGIAIPTTNMYFSAAHVPAGLLAVVINTVPIMTYAIAFLAGQERFSIWRVLGVTCCVAGILLIAIPHSGLSSPPFTIWLVTALLTPLCFAITAVFGVRQPKNSNPLSLAAGMLIASSILLTPIVLYNHDFYLIPIPLHTRDWLIMLEILLTSMSYTIFIYLLKIAGAVYYSLVSGIVSITGLLWGYFLFAEKFSKTVQISIALIIMGVLIASVTLKNQKTDNKNPENKKPSS